MLEYSYIIATTFHFFKNPGYIIATFHFFSNPGLTESAELLLLLSMLLISRSMDLRKVCLLAGPRTYRRYVSLPYVRLTNCHIHLFWSSTSSFSSQYLLLFLKSRSCLLLLLRIHFTSFICPSMAS